MSVPKQGFGLVKVLTFLRYWGSRLVPLLADRQHRGLSQAPSLLPLDNTATLFSFHKAQVEKNIVFGAGRSNFMILSDHSFITLSTKLSLDSVIMIGDHLFDT